MSVPAILNRRTVFAAVAIAATVGFGMSSDRQRSLNVGYRHNLHKPVEPSQLERLLDEAADKTRAHARRPA